MVILSIEARFQSRQYLHCLGLNYSIRITSSYREAIMKVASDCVFKGIKRLRNKGGKKIENF